MPGPTPHRTPLRRVSQGSLSALSRSGNYPDAPHGLGFLEPALCELADEAEALQANMEGLHNLGNALDAFNEGFASYLYVMEMNSLTTDWPQVCRFCGQEEQQLNCIAGTNRTVLRTGEAERRCVTTNFS